MDTAIANMTNKGMKNIADLSIEAFVDLMLDQGTVTIGDDEYDKDTLIKIWTDVAKDAFKQASKGKKTKSKAATGDKPARAKSGYLLFCEQRRPALNAEHNKDFKAVATALGEEWQGLGEAGKAEWNKKAEAAKPAATKPSPTKRGLQEATAPLDVTVEYATKAAETFAQENNLTDKIENGTITGTGKEKHGVPAIKLSDLKAWLKANPEAEEDVEEEDVEEDVEEDEAEDDPEAEAKSWVDCKCQTWTLEDDWKEGSVTSYNDKTKKHTVTYEDGTTETLNIQARIDAEEFEWIEEE